MRNRRHLALLAMLITLPATAGAAPAKTAGTDALPAPFLPGLLSDGLNNRDLTLTGDGNELFTSVTSPRAPFGVIVTSRREEGRWGALEVAPFSGRFNDIEPMLAPDGDALFFASRRPLDGVGSEEADWNLWRVERTATGWSNPEPLPVPINTREDEFYPSVTAAGTLYFTSAREGGMGREDIYRAERVDGGYAPPENLGAGVNSAAWEFNAFIAPDESYLLFSSQGREDELGGGDLYISERDASGRFGAARNLGPGVNSDSLDYCPFVTADGSTLYFTSNRHPPFAGAGEPLTYAAVRARFTGMHNGLGNVYRVPAADLLAPR